MKKCMGFWLFVLAWGQAQTLDCSQLMTQSFPTPPKLETAEVQITTTFEATPENDGMTTSIYQVMDVPKRRMYMEMSLPDDNKTITRYSDGKGIITMIMAGETITQDFPEAAGAQLEKLFDNILANQFLLPENYEVLSCDGTQNYAGLIEGEQITVRGDVPNLGNLEMRVIIDQKQQAFGSIMNIPQFGQTLSLMKGFGTVAGEMPKRIETTMYKLEGDAATLTMTMQLEYLSVNQPVDESLFSEQ
jgi:hypothetical protein